MYQRLISVIIPVYNVEKYLDECVSSIVKQTYENLEIILVDDGSTDNCPLLCDEWAKKDNRIKVVHKQNGGLSDARNAGMLVAQGELIGFVDSDDYIRDDMYELLYKNMKENDSDISACGVEMFWEDGTPNKNLTIEGSFVLNSEEAVKSTINETILKHPVWYKLYKKNLIYDIPFPVGKYHEEVFWTYQAVGKAKRISVFDIPCYFYRQRSESIMGAQYSLKRLDALEAKIQRIEYMQEHFPALISIAKCNFFFSCVYSIQMLLKFADETEKHMGIKIAKIAYRKYNISFKDIKVLKGITQIWLILSAISPTMTAKLRNTLGIGF